MRRVVIGAAAAVVSLALALALGACGEETAGSTQSTDTIFVPSDVGGGNVDVPKETNSFTLPPDFGDLCDENDDCVTGFCVQAEPGRFVCSRTCISACPDDWSCKGITSGSADLTFVCLPDAPDVPDVVEMAPDIPDVSEPDVPPDTGPDVPPDTGPDVPPDTGPTDPGSLCDPVNPPPTTGFLFEGGDFPDCITGCPEAATIGLDEIDLRSVSYAGATGQIDGNAHSYDFLTSGSGPDIDILAIRANPRDIIELAVQNATTGQPMDPLIYTSDGFATRTFNGDVSATNSCARTVVAFPFTSQSPIFVVIEDTVNYENWSPSGWTTTSGGGGFEWVLRVRVTPFAPVSLGSLMYGQMKTATGVTLQKGGDIVYYTFQAPANAVATVTLTRTGSTAFIPTLAGFKTDQNQLVWQRVRYDEDGDGVVTLGDGSFITCTVGSCGGAPTEWIFAVLDWNGDASPGSFSYDLKVELAPNQ